MTKSVLVAHRNATVRDRFASALTEAGQRVLRAATLAEVEQVVEREAAHLSLALLDVALSRPLVQGRDAGGGPGPTLAAFASTVESAAQARALAAAGVGAWVNDHSAPHQVVASLAPLLFHDSFNRRASPRVPVVMAVSCDVAGAVSSATALNLGRGGLALRPLAPIPVGTVMGVRFHLPAIGRDLTVDVRVCWTDARRGLGAQFERIGEDNQRALDAFVESHLPAAERG